MIVETFFKLFNFDKSAEMTQSERRQNGFIYFCFLKKDKGGKSTGGKIISDI